jgi:hypothetical protein
VSNKSRTEFHLESAFVSRGFKLVCLLSLAMLHWATILAVCPELHELIHHDADDEHHDCAVTAILSGGIEHTPIVLVAAAAPAPALECFDVSFDAQAAASFFLSCRILEHAPPLQS